MKSRAMPIILIALAALLGLTLGAQSAQSQGPGDQPQGVASPAAALAGAIPIQGRLTNAGGAPLNGHFSITASLYDTASGGTARCTDTDSVQVTNGLFTMNMDSCTSNDINGDQLYLGIKVGTDPEMTPRQPLYGVPYAWSLRPGAIISATGAGAFRFSLYAEGDVWQARTADGLIKAGAWVFCGDTGSTVYRSFNNVNLLPITVSNGSYAGECIVDFNFDVTDRYIVATATGGPRRNVTIVDLGAGAPDRIDLSCISVSGSFVNGQVMILVY